VCLLAGRSRPAWPSPQLRCGRALLEEAGRTGQDLVLDVLTVNRRAQALYRRLGLTEVARHGDRDTKVTMRSAYNRK
jgi:hypothetical protein